MIFGIICPQNRFFLFTAVHQSSRENEAGQKQEYQYLSAIHRAPKFSLYQASDIFSPSLTVMAGLYPKSLRAALISATEFRTSPSRWGS
jgi:hypothetical protein